MELNVLAPFYSKGSCMKPDQEDENLKMHIQQPSDEAHLNILAPTRAATFRERR